MALSTPISLYDDVRAEFGANTRPANATLTTYRTQIFGSGAGSLTDFVGTGKPTVGTTNTASSIGETSVTLNGNVGNTGGLTLSYYFEYDTNSSFSTPSTTSVQTTSTDNDSVSAIIVGLSNSTTYYFRIVVYNNYISNSSDHIIDTTNSKSFTTATASCDPPQNFSASANPNGFNLSWDDPTSGNPSNGYEIQYRVNSGSWTSLTTTSSTANTYSHNGCSSDFVNGDTVGYRIKGKCSGQDSSWVSDTGKTAVCSF